MKYLLDTSVWLRGTVEPETLPAPLQAILSKRDEVFGLSAISVWEVGKKAQIGKLHLKQDLLTWLKAAMPPHISLLPLNADVVACAMQLPDFPTRDPADELIVATACVQNLTLLTTDTKLKGYPHAPISYFTPIL